MENIDYGEFTEKQIQKLKQNIDDVFFQIPISALCKSTRYSLGRRLDPPKEISGKLQRRADVIGLAELIGYNVGDIEPIEYMQSHPNFNDTATNLLLENWNTPDANLGQLVFYISLLERWDILKYVHYMVERDVMSWLQRIQKKDNNSYKPPVEKKLMDWQPSIYRPPDESLLFTDDVLNKPPTGEPPIVYDAFISYEHDDMTNMIYITERLKKEGLRIACGTLSLLKPICSLEAYAEAVENRCRRVVLLISESFMKSSECMFQMTSAFAQDPASCRRKVVVVMLEKIQPPRLVAHLSRCNYYNKELSMEDCFWRPLIAALIAS